MHARGFLVTLCYGEFPQDNDAVLRLAADSLDWYAEEGYGIGDVEFEDGENPNSRCDGYVVGQNARFTFSDGTSIKPIDDAIQDIVDSGVGVGVVVGNVWNGWSQCGLDFCEGAEMDVIEESVEMMKREYSMEIESGVACVVGVLFDARVW